MRIETWRDRGHHRAMGSQPTYEELKHLRSRFKLSKTKGSQPTYEELKPDKVGVPRA